MIRINVNGYGFLDFDGKTSLSFKRNNVQYLWATVETGRSTEFTVPATDHNKQLLGFADDTVEYGEMMRKRLDCEIQYSGGVCQATIIVKKYNGNRFSCVLYYPKSEELEKLNDVQLKDCRCTIGDVMFDPSNVIGADDANLPLTPVSIVWYYGSYTKEGGQQKWCWMPSLSVKLYIENILTNLGINHDLDIPANLRIVSPTIKGASEVTGIIAKNGLEAGTIDASLQEFFEFKTDAELKWWGGWLGIGHTVDCWAIRPKKDVDVTFPSDFPNNVQLYNRNGNTYNPVTDRYRDMNGTWHGEPLAGRTVTFRAGQWFWILDSGWLHFDTDYYTGWKNDTSPFSYTLKVARSENIDIGEAWSPVYNHPEMTVIEYLRSVALMLGEELFYDYDDDVLRMRSQDVGSTQIGALENVVGIEQVSRNVVDWGDGTRFEIVKFDSEDYVEYPIVSEIEVNNSTLEGKTENTIKFSEGNDDGDGNVFIDDTEFSSTPPKVTAKKWTIAKSGTGKVLRRVEIENYGENGLIANRSTCLVARVKMDLYDYMHLTRQAVFMYRGTMYVWTSVNWTNGVATLTLQAL